MPKIRKPLHFVKSGYRSYGVIETGISAGLFYAPNFLMLIPYFEGKIWIFLVYNYLIMFILCGTIANLKFNDFYKN